MSGATVRILLSILVVVGVTTGCRPELADKGQELATGTAQQALYTVTLHKAVIEGANLSITYSKDFDTCAHLLNSSSQITHQYNFFCTMGSNITVKQPLSYFTGISGGTQVKLCHGNNYGICSSLVAVQVTPEVTLHRAVTEGSSLSITYSKNFDTCAHLLYANGYITHKSNVFCTMGSNITVKQPLSSFSGVPRGTQVKLCHGNNYGICSSLMTTQ